MIQVQRFKNRITIKGHAKYSEEGKDIVCAAVSILSWTLIKSLRELTTDKIESKVSKGYVDVRFMVLSSQGEILINSFFMGIESLIEVYGEGYVKII